MGIPTLLSTATETGVASIAITSNIDSTYDHYMFVLMDLNPVNDERTLGFQVSPVDDTGYNQTMTTAYWVTHHSEGGTDASQGYSTAADQAQGTAYQELSFNIGNGSDESGAGILHLFNPASTTYAKLFHSFQIGYHGSNYAQTSHAAGYINTTAAIDKISFKMNTGNMDGVIQLYGIA